jgi:hypothetical protein
VHLLAKNFELIKMHGKTTIERKKLTLGSEIQLRKFAVLNLCVLAAILETCGLQVTNLISRDGEIWNRAQRNLSIRKGTKNTRYCWV